MSIYFDAARDIAVTAIDKQIKKDALGKALKETHERMQMSLLTFMTGMYLAPWDSKKCKKCGGTGYRAVFCCGGFECSCQGSPTDFIKCGCECKPATDEQIEQWAKKRIVKE